MREKAGWWSSSHVRWDDDLVVTCDEIEDIPKSVLINPGNGLSYWFIAAVLLAFACLLLLVTIVV